MNNVHQCNDEYPIRKKQISKSTWNKVFWGGGEEMGRYLKFKCYVMGGYPYIKLKKGASGWIYQTGFASHVSFDSSVLVLGG